MNKKQIFSSFSGVLGKEAQLSLQSISAVDTVVTYFFIEATMANDYENNPVRLGFLDDKSPLQSVNLYDWESVSGYSMTDIDLLKIINLDKIGKMTIFEKDWNGNGGLAFSKDAIALFTEVIEKLRYQPQIAPTGRGTLLMQYDLNDGGILAFEVGEYETQMVYIPEGDYLRAQMEMYEDRIIQRISDCVERIYGIRQDRE